MNGSYACARFGYDNTMGEFNPSLRAGIRELFPDAERVSVIVTSKQGRDCWKQSVSNWKGKFDLSKNS